MKKELFIVIIFIFILFNIIFVSAQQSIDCNQDSDCPPGIFFGNTNCSGNNVVQNYYNFTCINPEINTSNCLPNYFYNLFVKSCDPSTQVCYIGECYNPVCYVNSTCNDNNSSTEDICNNPGKFNAYCTNMPIRCLNDLACGTSGFIYSPFCADTQNLFQTYLNFTCINPSTANSDCIVNQIPKLLKQCNQTQLCSNELDDCCNIKCSNNLTCNDNNLYTEDSCFNPGTCQSDCIYRNIACINNNDCDDHNASTEEFCINPNTTSSYCSGCSITCFNDASCGVNSPMGNLFCLNNNSYQNYITYKCNNSGTCNSFCSSSTAPLLNKTCNSTQLCSNGICENACFNNLDCADGDSYTYDECMNQGTLQSQCIYKTIFCLENDPKCNDNNVSTFDYCIFPGTPESNCSHEPYRCILDAQCGITGFTGNSYCQNGSVYQKYAVYTCNLPQTNQSYCTNSTQSQLKQACDRSQRQTCSNGACANVICYNNSECDDGNISTQDICNFPGTAQSYCSNSSIRCFNTSDCGTNGWANNPFCNPNDVFDNYMTYTCNLPGTIQSSCSSTDLPILKQDCNSSQLCSNATCCNVKCFSDLGCNDNNTHTQDRCANPGTCNSVCSITPIHCLNDLECNDINDHTKDICNNPGEPNSNCTYLPINCTSDSDLLCNDENDHTEDHCTSPNTTNSICTHLPIKCLNNLECGNRVPILTPFCNANIIFQNYLTPICNSPGTSQSNCSNSTTVEEIQRCTTSQGCSGGVCQNITCFNDLNCSDNNISTEDYCNKPGQLDAYCTHLPIICSNNITCNDNDINTEDICNLPGTPNSTCSNLPIACFNNAKCGADRDMLPPFCGGNNQVQYHHLTFTCNIPGTSRSYCTNSTSVVINKTCLTSELCSNGTCQNVPCFNNLNCSDNNISTEDYCNKPGQLDSYCTYSSIRCFYNQNCTDNNDSTEDICNSPGNVNSTCSNLPIACFNNVRCGNDRDILPPFCGNNYDIQYHHLTFTCNNPGTSRSICSNTTSVVTNKTCSSRQLCSNGTCQIVECFNDSECDDHNSSTWNKCTNPGQLNADCIFSTIRCFNNQECNDNNPHTEDTCNNPGLENANCTYLAIKCIINQECGNDTFIGNKICSGNDIRRDYLTFTCNNNGTSRSYCTNITTSPIVDNCNSTQECINAECRNIRCFDDSWCNDNNPHTEDHCIDNPGTSTSRCSYTNINCTSDSDLNCKDNNNWTQDICNLPNTTSSYCTHPRIRCFVPTDCGNNGLTGNNYCSQDLTSVLGNYLSYQCNSPGTYLSTCSNTTSPLLTQTCSSEQLCENAICKDVPCFNNEECRDTDPYTHDSCNNPGTLQSRCIHENMTCINVNDPRCDDHNVSTKDICIDPNTTSSFCDHRTIICIDDSWCGQNRIIGNRFCSQDNMNIVSNFLHNKCNLPGTPESYCTTFITNITTDTCLTNQRCDAGICKNVRCFVDQNCTDINPYTKDECINPGTVQSLCRYTNITCLNEGDPKCDDHNIDTEDHCINPGNTTSYCQHLNIICWNDLKCGNNSYVGDKFCNVNDVNWNYMRFTCNNPGTSRSNCTSSTEIQRLWTCNPNNNQLCSNGRCVNFTCKNDNQCNDFKDHTKDVCNNPGTLASNCSHIPIMCLNDLDINCNDNNWRTQDICLSPGLTNSTCINKYIICFNNSMCGTDGLFGSNFCTNNNLTVSSNSIGYTCNVPGTGDSYCTNSTSIMKVQDCASNYRCDIGVCKKVNCSNNAMCNDNEPYTLERCEYPGTVRSFCNITPINCTREGDLRCNDNNILTEDHCKYPNTTSSYCQHLPIICINNSMCGNDSYVGDKFCNGFDLNWNYRTFTCNNPGTSRSNCTNSTAIQRLWTCFFNQTCSNGRCVNVNCSNDAMCNNNDPYTEDKCINNRTVQSFCNYTNITCLTINDTKCDDHNRYTEDRCINPNKTSSYCTNETIRCFNATDCGNNTFIDNKFCTGNEVHWNFLTYTCNLNSTVNSYCTNSTENQRLWTCNSSNQLCSTGRCVNITCFTENDVRCDDNDPRTFDKCVNPNTTSSYCNRTNICYNDSQCGISGPVGNQYCDGNTILQNNLTYRCINPNTTISYCMNYTTNQTITPNCEFGCIGSTNSNASCKTDPNIPNVSSPLGIIYNRPLIQINVSTNDIADKIDYIDKESPSRWLCTRCSSYGFTRKQTKSFSEGNHTIIFRSIRGTNIKPSKTISFFVDSKNPKIISAKPTSNQYTNGSYFYIKYNEDNCESIKLLINGNIKNSSICKSGRSINKTFSLNISSYNGQEIEYQFIITDIANNTDESKKTKIEVDTTSPKINKLDAQVNGRYVNLNINITELNLDKVQYQDLYDGNLERWITLCTRLNKNNECITKINYNSGIHNLIIRVTDKAGNSVNKEIEFEI